MCGVACLDAANRAHQDPEINDFWPKLGTVLTIQAIYTMRRVEP